MKQELQILKSSNYSSFLELEGSLPLSQEHKLVPVRILHGADALREKSPVMQLLKNFPTFYESPKFITVFRCSPLVPEPDQSSPYHPILSL
jgi:hypothetical protein